MAPSDSSPCPDARDGLPPGLGRAIDRALFDRGVDAICVSDAGGVAIAANDRLLELIGLDRVALVGRRLDELFVDGGERNGDRRILRLAGGGTRAVRAIERELEDGHRLILLRQSSAPGFEGHDPGASEDRLVQAVRVATIGIFDHDHESGHIYWSPEECRFHGIEPGTVVTPELFLALVHPEDHDRIQAAVKRAHDPKGDGLFDVEHRIVRQSDGAVRWLKKRSLTFFEGEGEARRPVRTVGAVRDVTEDKIAEGEREELRDQLVQAQKLESLGRLAGGIAHDFNNMLSVILGHAELASRQLDDNQPLQAELDQIRKAARRSAVLTRQLLGFARRQAVLPEVLDLGAVVESSLEMLSRLIGENIRLERELPDDLWPVCMDPSQVDQVLANLAVNARDAIAGQGRIAIRAANAVAVVREPSAAEDVPPGDYVMLEVSDDGCGFDAQTLAHAFDPFFTTKEKGRGTGLGLATVYGIVKQNGGTISVESREGEGATFRIHLPRHRGVGSRKPEPEPSEPVQGTETILLVEDEPSVLRLNETLLEDLGYRVLAAATPSEALRLAERHLDEIRLLVTDVVMPEMNGPELARRLTRMRADLKCLFMSGYFDAEGRDQPQRSGHFLAKPYTFDDLAAGVREALA